MINKISVINVVGGLSPSMGGPTRTVVQLADSLSYTQDIKSIVVSQAHIEQPIAYPSSNLVDCNIGFSQNILALKFGFPGRKALADTISKNLPDILHSNGIWHPLNYWCSSASRKYDIPLVIQPRGMLEPWALSWQPFKKNLALTLYQRRDLERASLFIATAEQEMESFRKFGLRQPIAVIPNGINLHNNLANSTKTNPSSKRKRNCLFLSRIHPKKGLENLLRAWAGLKISGWVLQIAGSDEGGYLHKVLSLARDLGIEQQICYLGEIGDDAKWAIYRNADLFILPSFSENFGLVVAEALSQGVPVIATKGTPWKDLQEYGCGWWVEPTIFGLSEALSRALFLPPEILSEMGWRGHNYVQQYNWVKVANQMLSAYRWILNQEDKPKFVHL